MGFECSNEDSLEGPPTFQKARYFPLNRTGNMSNSDHVAVFLPSLATTVHYCIAFPPSFQRQVLGKRVSGYTDEIALRSGSSDRHRSNLLLDLLLAAMGHSNVTRVLSSGLKVAPMAPF